MSTFLCNFSENQAPFILTSCHTGSLGHRALNNLFENDIFRRCQNTIVASVRSFVRVVAAPLPLSFDARKFYTAGSIRTATAATTTATRSTSNMGVGSRLGTYNNCFKMELCD